MDTRFIILGSCVGCGQLLSIQQMIDSNTAKCICGSEHHVHIDLEPMLTIEEWEQQHAGKELEATDDCSFVPF